MWMICSYQVESWDCVDMWDKLHPLTLSDLILNLNKKQSCFWLAWRCFQTCNSVLCCETGDLVYCISLVSISLALFAFTQQNCVYASHMWVNSALCSRCFCSPRHPSYWLAFGTKAIRWTFKLSLNKISVLFSFILCKVLIEKWYC